MSDLLKRPDVKQAIELYALQPEVTATEVANAIGVSRELIYIWRKNPNFVDAIYERYMVEFGSELPAVLQAMIREAKAGNVQAGRLILEHSGKLVKNVNVTIDSPFEKFLKADKVEIEYEDAEIEDIVDSVPDIEAELPERNTESQIRRTKREKKQIKKRILSETQKKKRNAKRKEWNAWIARAKKVGMEALPARRPTPAQKQEWREEIIRRENENEQKENK
tara:strand:+ start:552 stop:1217 length:666 start_codon:yes stop_codon:yes gene_type:complete